jgi:hypothetical protein
MTLKNVPSLSHKSRTSSHYFRAQMSNRCSQRGLHIACSTHLGSHSYWTACCCRGCFGRDREYKAQVAVAAYNGLVRKTSILQSLSSRAPLLLKFAHPLMEPFVTAGSGVAGSTLDLR